MLAGETMIGLPGEMPITAFLAFYRYLMMMAREL